MPDSQWFYIAGDQQVGPVSEGQLRELIRRRELIPETLVWTETMTDWAQVAATALFQPAAVAGPALVRPARDDEREWCYMSGNMQEGPVPQEELVKMFREGLLDPRVQVWSAPMTDWAPAIEVGEFRKILGAMEQAKISEKKKAEEREDLLKRVEAQDRMDLFIRNSWIVFFSTSSLSFLQNAFRPYPNKVNDMFIAIYVVVTGLIYKWMLNGLSRYSKGWRTWFLLCAILGGLLCLAGLIAVPFASGASWLDALSPLVNLGWCLYTLAFLFNTDVQKEFEKRSR